MSQPAGEAGRLEAPGHCVGCGQRPQELHPIEAVASLRLVQRRSTTLARRGQPDKLAFAGQPDPSSKAGADAAGRIPSVLASVDRRLRHLFAEPEPLAVVRGGPRGERQATNIADSLASVSDVAERLVATIAGATTEDWYRRRLGQDDSGAEITWLALHEVVHDLDEVERSFARPSAARDARWADSDPFGTNGRVIALERFPPDSGFHCSDKGRSDWSGAAHFWGDDAS